MADDPIKIDPGVLRLAYKQGLLYAVKKLRGFHDSGLVGQIDAYDVTNEAVAKTLSGDRPWNPEKNPDLFVHLAGCISSIISNAYKSSNNQLVERSKNSESIIANSSENSLAIDEEIELQSKIEFIFDYLVKKREDIKHVAAIILRDRITEPRDIAQTLNMTVAEVNTKKLAIRRIMEHTDFLLHYISANREDLLSIASAVYKEKINDTKALSQALNMSTGEARKKKDELDALANDIYRGIM